MTLVVRPEMVEVDAAQPHAQAIVRRSAYLGNVVEYDLEVAGQLLTVVEHDPRHGQVSPEESQRCPSACSKTACTCCQNE